MASEFFFVLGMPRCRTAWLSVLLTSRDSFCFHEGAGAFLSFESYAGALWARPEHFAGDSSPALLDHIDSVLTEFPDARFLIVRRDPDEAREAFCAAAPKDAEAIRAGWAAYMEAFESAAAKLPQAMTVDFGDLHSEVVCDSLCHFLLRKPMDRERWRQLRDLRITSTFPVVADWRNAEPVNVSVNVEGFDFTGLIVRHYDSASDRDMVAGWWAKHEGEPMGWLHLPPLGIVVEDSDGPAAALWCYETYGAGVAWIALPVTRPGLTLERASTVLAFAVLAITQLAGKAYTPPARFTNFRVTCPPAMSRLLVRLGFTELPQRSNLFLSV